MRPLRLFTSLICAAVILSGCSKPEIREWDSLNLKHVRPELTGQLWTRFHKGQLIYIFKLTPATEEFVRQEYPIIKPPTFRLKLTDKVGFALMNEEIEWRDFALNKEENGSLTMSIQKTVSLDEDDYASLHSWTLIHTNLPSVPDTQITP